MLCTCGPKDMLMLRCMYQDTGRTGLLLTPLLTIYYYVLLFTAT